jgi:hypothetical protein
MQQVDFDEPAIGIPVPSGRGVCQAKNLYVMYRAINSDGVPIAYSGVMLRAVTAWYRTDKKGSPRYRLASAEELDCA